MTLDLDALSAFEVVSLILVPLSAAFTQVEFEQQIAVVVGEAVDFGGSPSDLTPRYPDPVLPLVELLESDHLPRWQHLQDVIRGAKTLQQHVADFLARRQTLGPPLSMLANLFSHGTG